VAGNAGAGSGAASPGGAASGGGGGNGSPIKQANLSPILIGNIGEYSGVVGASIGTGQPTVGVTVKWINDHGGLNGHPIKMFSADDGTDPGRYQALAQQMVEIQHVVAFLANLVPLSAPGADAYLNQKKVPVVGGDLANALEFQSPMVFPEGTSLATLAIGTAKLAVAQGKPKMAVFWCAEAAVCHQFNAAITSPQASPTGVQIVYDAQVSLAQPDYTAECLKAESSGAQTIMLAVDANSMERAARSCVQNGVKPLWVSASLAVINAEAKDADLNGLTAPVPTFPWVASDIPTAQTYQAALQHYATGVETSSGSAAVWTSGMLLMKASTNLPANNPTSADILKGLWAIHNDNLGGLTTSLTFHQDGLPTVPSCFFYLVVQGGRWVAPVGSQQQCL
jgi:branched-chain amino acid transport system substrate-binding protein